jgi:hypothetical protein
VADIKVRNIGTMAVPVIGLLLRPGKTMVVDYALLNGKVRAMHGKQLWIGEGYRATKAAPEAEVVVGDAPMTVSEAREVLLGLPKEQLLSMCGCILPTLEFSNDPPREVIAARLGRALFTPDRIVDPETFFWLRRWTKVGEAYIER